MEPKKNLKENKPGTRSSYRQEIDWIMYEVDFVPDDIETYKKWPEPWKTKALKALKYRKQHFDQMSKDKLKTYESKQFKLANIAKKILKENSNEVDQLFKFLDHPWQEDGEIEFVSLLDQNRGNFKTSNWAATLRYLRGMDKANSNLSMMASDKFLTMWDDLIK